MVVIQYMTPAYFLKTGSLSSNTVSVEPIGGGGLIAPEPYSVRECLPGQFVFTLSDTPSFNYVVKFDIGGTAIPGYDYTPIPDSIIIPGGQISATAFVYGLPVPPVGPKTVILYIKAPFNCNGITYVDTVQMNIYDSLYAHILTPDTTVCRLPIGRCCVYCRYDTFYSVVTCRHNRQPGCSDTYNFAYADNDLYNGCFIAGFGMCSGTQFFYDHDS